MKPRKAPVIGLIAGLAMTVTFSLLPSGAGQHYSAVFENGVRAIGNVVGGGASATVPVAFAPPFAEVTFFAGREIGVSIDPPDGPFRDEIAYGCIKIVTPTATDEGCSNVKNFIPQGNIFLPGYAQIHFSVPSWNYPGTRIQAILTLVAKSLPTIVPTFDQVFEPDENDFFFGPMLSLQWKAVSSGTLNSGGLGTFVLPVGNGQISQGIGLEAENCEGDCIEEEESD